MYYLNRFMESYRLVRSKMKMRNYIKIERERTLLNNLAKFAECLKVLFLVKGKLLLVVLFSGILVLSLFLFYKGFSDVTLSSEGSVQFKVVPLAVTSTKTAVISIPSGMIKANPFLPYRDLGDTTPVNDVPEFTLVEPPETINENSDAARVMDTIVSGILYDKYSPSAILNIEGVDYLVKKGDIVNNYKVLSIVKDSVTVKLGSNVYKAGIGEILTEGTLNHNDVSNLNNKFGGVQ